MPFRLELPSTPVYVAFKKALDNSEYIVFADSRCSKAFRKSDDKLDEIKKALT